MCVLSSRRAAAAFLVAASTALLHGCASKPVQPPTAAAAPAAPPSPVFFAGVLNGRGPCPEGQAEFLVEWEQSPDYDPLIVFFARPRPRPVCIDYPGDVADALKGLVVQLQRVGKRYDVRDFRSHPAQRVDPSPGWPTSR